MKLSLSLLFVFVASFFVAAFAREPAYLTPRYYGGPSQLADTCVWLTVDTCSGSGAADCRAEARVALHGLKERKGFSREEWELNLAGPAGAGLPDTISMRLRWGNTDYGAITDERIVRLEVRRGGETLFDDNPEGYATVPGAFNTLVAELSDSGTRLRLSGGGETDRLIADISLSAPFAAAKAGLRLTGKAAVGVFAVAAREEPSAALARGLEPWTVEALSERFARSADPLEGFWTYLDRENNPAYARPGGSYTLAVVGAPGGVYQILYISGARIFSDRWKPCMLKGILRPTIFSGQYSLEWIDAEFEPIIEELSADLAGGAVLALRFPLYESVLRFSKLPR